MRPDRVDIIRFATIVLAYFISGYIGLQFPYYGSNVTLIWAPSGIALATLVAWGWRYWPAVLIAALLVNLTTSAPVYTAALIACGNTLAAVLPVILFRRFLGSHDRISFRGIIGMIGFGVVLNPLISSLLGTLVLCLTVIGDFSNYREIWQGWWLGDLVGVTIIGSVVLRLLSHDYHSRDRAFYIELACAGTAAVIASSVVHLIPTISHPEYMFLFVSLPFALWGAIRFGLFGTTIINALISFDLVVFAASGHSAFVNTDLSTALTNMYGYLVAVTLSTLVLAAGMENIAHVNRNTADGRITSEIHRLRTNLAIVVGATGFLLSIAAAGYTYLQIDAARKNQTELFRRAFEASLREELGRATDSLVAVRTLFDVDTSVSHDTFDAMIGPWVKRRPGVAALEWAPRISQKHRQLIEESAIQRGVEDFLISHFVDGKKIVAPIKDAYYPIFYIFPRSGNERAVGFDLSSEPTRRAALEKAQISGEITLTPPLKLVQSGVTNVHALAFLSVPDRRNPDGPPLGFAAGILRLTHMIRRAEQIARLPSDFEIILADLKAEDGLQLIYSNRSASVAMDQIRKQTAIDFNPHVSDFSFGDRDWTIILHNDAGEYGGIFYWQPWAIFIFGATISILLVIYLRSLTRTERRIVDLVYQRTQELDNARRDAEVSMNKALQADRAKSEFIAHMSHEFRSPMTSILGYAQLARDAIDNLEPSETIRGYLVTINSAGQHVLSLIGDVLDLSKIEAGKLVLENTPTDIHGICEEVVSMMMVPARNQNNRIHLQIPTDMPRWVMGDPVRIKQVLTNLVSNAIKFTKFGNIHVVVTSRGITDEHLSFRIEVRDEGIGIPPDKVQSLFEAFTQVDTSTTRRFGGTGLGLAICQKMILAMGGSIDAESTEGEGSVFWFDLNLPLATPTRSNLPDVEDSGSDTPASQGVIGRNLLLVEDIEINRILAQKLLEQQGHIITTASDGQEAIDILTQQDFDAILMDVHMPVMDGIEATRQIREFEDAVKATIPVLALTADTSSDNLTAFREAGMDAHCTKPLDIKAINREIKRLEYRMLAERKEQLTNTRD
ncbi:ATP-binding protein [Thalassospira alkalitolerans]|uniref:ATP-binding protein n=1 Tax=Thalassospira alkalitolerans TaxID=1293890 RepID=UPI003AA7F464